MSLFFVLAVSLGASSCKERKSEIELVILHTNDVHSRFDAGSAGHDDNIFRLGGLARLKTLIDQQRAKHPNTLLVDGGDWSEGGIFYTVDAGRNILRLMDQIGYDAAVMGNHDFLNGPVEVARRVADAKTRVKVVAANKDLSLLSSAEQKEINKYVPDYAIFKVGDLRVAVIGVTTVATEYQSFFEPGKIKDYKAATAAVAKKIHDQKLADIQIVLSHNHTSDNINIAKTVPYIQAVISGHDHNVTPKPIEVQNAGLPVYVVEAGEWGKFLGKLTFAIDVKKRSIKLKKYELIPVVEKTPEHLGIKNMIAAEMRKVISRFGYDVFNDEVGNCEDEMPIQRKSPTALATILAESYRESAQTDVGVEQSDLIGTGLPKGRLTSRALFDVVPYIFSPIAGRQFPQEGRSWTVHRLTLTGTELFTLLNIAATAPTLGLPIGWIAVTGARLEYAPSDQWSALKGAQILNRETASYEDLNFDGTYTLALSDGVLRALKIIDVPISKVENTGVETWRALHRSVQTRGSVLPEDYSPEGIYVATDGDLGLLRHNVQFEKNPRGYSIYVRVTNTGLTATTPMKLRVLKQNKPNDPVNAGEASAYVVLRKDIPIPALDPGATTVLQLEWSKNVYSGATPFRFYLDGKDALSRNNSLSVNIHVP